MPRAIAGKPNGKWSCMVCGAALTFRGKLCSDECRKARKRQLRQEHNGSIRSNGNGNGQVNKFKYFTCDPIKEEEGCVFYLTCMSNIRNPRWNPYCAPISKYHALFVNVYGRLEDNKQEQAGEQLPLPEAG